MKTVINMETIKKNKTQKILNILFWFVILLAFVLFIILVSFVFYGMHLLLTH